MLTLSRRVNETITITHKDGTVITVMLVEVRGDKARLGIDAPMDVRIMRTELIQKPIDPESITHDPTIGEDYA